MKEVFSTVNRIFLPAVTAIQSVFALILLVTSIRSGEASILSFVLTALAIALAVFCVLRKNKGWVWVAVFIFTMPIVTDTALSKEHIAALPAAPRGTVQELLLQRFVWPYISEFGYSYGLDVMDDSEYIKLAISSELIWDEFFPAVEEDFGDYSQEIYLKYVSLSMEAQKRKVFPDLLKDLENYFFAPFTTEMSFYGHAQSLNGRNYQAVKDRMGVLGRIYYHFGFAAFLAVMLLGVINIFANKAFPGVKITVLSLLLIIINTLYSCFFPLRGFDYKNAVWIVIIWALYWCVAMRGSNADT